MCLLTLQVLTAHQSNRVCNALALLQCVASHPDTRLEATWLQHLDQQLVFTIDQLLTIPPAGLHSSWRTSPSTSTPSSTRCPRPGLHNLYLFLFFWESLKGFLAHHPIDFACALFPMTNLQIVSGHLSIWDLLLLESLGLWSRQTSRRWRFANNCSHLCLCLLPYIDLIVHTCLWLLTYIDLNNV